MNKKRVAIKIQGRVQGVAFRVNAQIQARQLGLGGWVENLADGSVLVVAEGEKINLQKLIQWCQRGPSAAQVKHVITSWRHPSGQSNNFTIIY